MFFDAKVTKNEVIWYFDNNTKNIIYAIDGEDNRDLFSFAAVKDGILAHPEKLNHFDLWFTNKYSVPEVTGIVKLKVASDASLETKLQRLIKNLKIGKVIFLQDVLVNQVNHFLLMLMNLIYMN
jgi:hypothetical protein